MSKLDIDPPIKFGKNKIFVILPATYSKKIFNESLVYEVPIYLTIFL